MSISPQIPENELWPEEPGCPVELLPCLHPSCSDNTNLLYTHRDLAIHQQEQHPDYAQGLYDLGTPPSLSSRQPTPTKNVITRRDACLSESSQLNTPPMAKVTMPLPPGRSAEGIYFNGPVVAPEAAPALPPAPVIPTFEEVDLDLDNCWGPSNPVRSGVVGVSPYTVQTIEKWCEYSKSNEKWHVKYGKDGKMGISFDYNNIPNLAQGESLALKLELKRIDPNWDRVPIDQVCRKHTEGGLIQHCIMPARGEERSGRYYNETVPGSYSVLYYNCDSLLGPDGNMSIKIAVWYPCTQSCPNSATQPAAGKLASRQSDLVIQLEKRTSDDIRTVLNEFRVPVWIKASINKDTFERPERLKKMGAAAQQQAKKRKLEVQANVKTELEEDVLKHIWLQQGRQLFLEGKVTQDEVMNIFQSPTA